MCNTPFHPGNVRISLWNEGLRLLPTSAESRMYGVPTLLLVQRKCSRGQKMQRSQTSRDQFAVF